MADPILLAPAPGERVLPTLNHDGSRRWIRPKPSAGPWRRRRRAVAYALMAIFLIVPYLRMNGRPLMLFDLPQRRFDLFGTTFLPTDTVLFQLLFLSAVIAIFLFTALLGRVWCGWGCPQTVYMEFLFRPIERWLEGGYLGSRRLDGTRGPHARRLLKHAIYVVVAMVLAHTFLGYFVGVETLARWVRLSPVEHPTAFLVMLGTTALIFFDFAYFREQTCMVACPYGRLQSVLLDRRSAIVAYDARRGEPRGKLSAALRGAAVGDCVDCGLCVQTCPTGIDIRQGLQMECIHCTQCMDACDSVMAKLHRPAGLIRYGSRDAMEGRPAGWLRPRVVLYPLALAVSLGLFVWMLGTRSNAEVTLLGPHGAPYAIEGDGSVVNQVRVKITNRGAVARKYSIVLDGAPGARMIAPENPMSVAAGAVGQTSVFVISPADSFAHGERAATFRVVDGAGFELGLPYRLIGPEPVRGVEDRR